MAPISRTHDRPNASSLRLCMELADLYFDGHFTLLKFTTNWRAGFFTPNDRSDISRMEVGSTADEAMRNAITRHSDNILAKWAEIDNPYFVEKSLNS